MATKHDKHANELHVGRPIEKDIERLLNDETIAAASFDSVETRMVLTDYAIKKMWKQISEWLGQAANLEKRGFWYYFDEDDQTNLSVPIEHVGCIRDAATNRILLRTTTIICVVIQRDDQTDAGYVIYNSYPSTALDHHGRTLDFDPMPYVMATDIWTSAPRMRRTFWRLCCSPTLDWRVDYDPNVNSVVMVIQESDDTFGTVSCGSHLVVWHIDKSTHDYHTKPFVRDIMTLRAFPETTQKVRRVYEMMELGNIDDRLIGDASIDRHDVIDLRALVRPTLSTTTSTEPVETETETDEILTEEDAKLQAAIERKRKQALKRSRKNTKPTRRKPKTAKKRKNAGKPKKPTTAFKFTRVKTKAETEPYPQDVQNYDVISLLCRNWIPLYNEMTHEFLCPIPCWYPYGDDSGWAFAQITPDEADKIRAAIDDENDPLPKPSTSARLEIPYDYQKIIDREEAPELRNTPSKSEWVRIKKAIAADGNWKACVNADIAQWLNLTIRDEYGRSIVRKTDTPETSVAYFDDMPEVIEPTEVIDERMLESSDTVRTAFDKLNNVLKEANQILAKGDTHDNNRLSSPIAYQSPSTNALDLPGLSGSFFSPASRIQQFVTDD